MFIETEGTPNPATLKFLPGREVMGAAGTADFSAVAITSKTLVIERANDIEAIVRNVVRLLGGER